MVLAMSTPVSHAADLLRTLGDETRLKMLALLCRRELCVCEIVDLFPVSQPAISGHLRRLKDAGLVQDERRGMWVYYRATDAIPPLAQAVLDEVVLPPELEAAALGVCEETDCCTVEPAAVGIAEPPATGAPRRRPRTHGPQHRRAAE